MERLVKIVTARELKAFIAARYLGETDRRQIQIGSVQLQPHQISAVQRVRAVIAEVGGALLADDVGMGKTFVALAVARSFHRVAVVAPAALRDMWAQAADRAEVEIEFHSFEFLSRGGEIAKAYDFIIVDEAHHVRNPATVRYQRLAKTLARSRVVLLSATPIHNFARDLASLLALFIGNRAHALSAEEMSRYLVRRRMSEMPESKVPELKMVNWIDIEDDDTVPQQLLALPPPVPPKDGGLAAALVARSLVRAWCSSEAALRSAIVKRLARCTALRSALESGAYPTEKELSAWTFAEDSVQLAFPSLVANAFGSCGEILEAVNGHEAALRRVLPMLDCSRDVTRANVIRNIRRAHDGVSVVVFSQYAASVTEMFRLLRNERGVGVITSGGARVAGGAISRRDAIERFAPRASGVRMPAQAEGIDLLLATDLLSEGVNLQDAGVVIHLDLPWTAARLEQRIGRVRRMASQHAAIHAYGIRPISSAEQLLHLDEIVSRKGRESERVIGASMHTIPKATSADEDDPVSTEEALRAVLREWIDENAAAPAIPSHTVAAAGISASAPGILALILDRGRRRLIGFSAHGDFESASRLLRMLRSMRDGDVELAGRDVEVALARCREWIMTRATTDVIAVAEIEAARARRRSVNRISSLVRGARADARPGLTAVAASARSLMLGQLGISREEELENFSRASSLDETWLSGLGSFLPLPDNEHVTETSVLALLLLVTEDVE